MSHLTAIITLSLVAATLSACGTAPPIQPLRDFTAICKPSDRCTQIGAPELYREAALAPPPQQDLRQRR